MKPIVTVCMPVYNQAKFLSEAIESVLRQTFADFELLIVDDCSSDNSIEIIRFYADNDARIRFFVNEHNIGMVHNWNRCLREASGEFIKFLFGDDMFSSPQTLEKMVKVLSFDEEVVLASSARFFIDQNSTVMKIVSDYMGPRRCDGAVAIMDSLIDQKNNIGEPSAVIFRKKYAERGFNPEYCQIVDLEMWFHLLEQGKFVYIPEPLCAFRVHSEQQTKRNFDSGLYINDSFFLLRDYSNKPYLKFSCIQRKYMYFTPAYNIWKLYYKHNRFSRKVAEDMIFNKYHYSSFIFYIVKPFFRLYKFYYRYKRMVLRRFLSLCSQ